MNFHSTAYAVCALTWQRCAHLPVPANLVKSIHSTSLFAHVPKTRTMLICGIRHSFPPFFFPLYKPFCLLLKHNSSRFPQATVLFINSFLSYTNSQHFTFHNKLKYFFLFFFFRPNSKLLNPLNLYSIGMIFNMPNHQQGKLQLQPSLSNTHCRCDMSVRHLSPVLIRNWNTQKHKILNNNN